MKKRIGVVHALFECQDCEATFEKHKNAQALAARHAKHYNHYVSGTIKITQRAAVKKSRRFTRASVADNRRQNAMIKRGQDE